MLLLLPVPASRTQTLLYYMVVVLFIFLTNFIGPLIFFLDHFCFLFSLPSRHINPDCVIRNQEMETVQPKVISGPPTRARDCGAVTAKANTAFERGSIY